MARALGYSSYVQRDSAEAINQAKASLRKKDAHNCNLLFTSDLLESLPKLGFDIWPHQGGAAHKVIQHHQHHALVRGGIFVSSATATTSS
jgi:hypothetical protein